MKVPKDAFDVLRQGLQDGKTSDAIVKEIFSDVRPPRFDPRTNSYVVRRHDGKNTIESAFDSIDEADDFYRELTNTTTKEGT